MMCVNQLPDKVRAMTPDELEPRHLLAEAPPTSVMYE